MIFYSLFFLVQKKPVPRSLCVALLIPPFPSTVIFLRLISTILHLEPRVSISEHIILWTGGVSRLHQYLSLQLESDSVGVKRKAFLEWYLMAVVFWKPYAFLLFCFESIRYYLITLIWVGSVRFDKDWFFFCQIQSFPQIVFRKRNRRAVSRENWSVYSWPQTISSSYELVVFVDVASCDHPKCQWPRPTRRLTPHPHVQRDDHRYCRSFCYTSSGSGISWVEVNINQHQKPFLLFCFLSVFVSYCIKLSAAYLK